MLELYEIQQALGSVIDEISDKIIVKPPTTPEQDSSKTPSDTILGAIWSNRKVKLVDPGRGKLDHPIAHLIVRLARDVELDHVFAPHSDGFQNRLSVKILLGFFRDNLRAIWYDGSSLFSHIKRGFCADANLLPHCANFGCIKEDGICDDILQSLIYRPKLYDHQADALIVLLKPAGATDEAYAGRSAVSSFSRTTTIAIWRKLN